MMCYFIFWLIQLPFMLLSPQKVRHLFVAKSLIIPATWLSMLIWSVVKVPISQSMDQEHSTLSGKDLQWAYIKSMNSALGVWLTLAVNIPDFTASTSHSLCQ